MILSGTNSAGKSVNNNNTESSVRERRHALTLVAFYYNAPKKLQFEPSPDRRDFKAVILVYNIKKTNL